MRAKRGHVQHTPALAEASNRMTTAIPFLATSTLWHVLELQCTTKICNSLSSMMGSSATHTAAIAILFICWWCSTYPSTHPSHQPWKESVQS